MIQECQRIIEHLTHILHQLGFRPVVHFELEGVYKPKTKTKLDYSSINRILSKLGIEGFLKAEYWCNQWEYASLFNHQSPLQEANNLAKAIAVLPHIMIQFGAEEVWIQPVIWGGDQGRFVTGTKIFSTDSRPVHIPNAIQINMSIESSTGENLIYNRTLGEWLQYQLLQTSHDCCLLFLPEEDAYKRLRLKRNYQLDAELTSPHDLSGGHQGSVALYKQWGKHNQPMGVKPLIYAADNSLLSFESNWQQTARVEHRLGATSLAYDPYINMVFILLNMLEAIQRWQQSQTLPKPIPNQTLPGSLYDQKQQLGAIQLFQRENWFAPAINHFCQKLSSGYQTSMGTRIKQKYLTRFLPRSSVLAEYR